MKKLAVVIVLIVLAIGVVAYADDLLPEGVEIFQLPAEGLTCVVWPDGSGDCYCPCDVECNLPSISTKVETRIPDETPVPPTNTPIPPTDTPVPPTEKPKCNRGLGNGSENCDPGNSGGKPGAAGEDNE